MMEIRFVVILRVSGGSYLNPVQSYASLKVRIRQIRQPVAAGSLAILYPENGLFGYFFKQFVDYEEIMLDKNACQHQSSEKQVFHQLITCKSAPKFQIFKVDIFTFWHLFSTARFCTIYMFSRIKIAITELSSVAFLGNSSKFFHQNKK